jgi:hypothetical protein
MKSFDHFVSKYREKFVELHHVYGTPEYQNAVSFLIDKMEKELSNRPKKDHNMIDVIQVGFYLTIFLQNRVREFGKDDYIEKVNEFLSKKKYEYYYHIDKLANFPDKYKVGRGNLLGWNSIPDSVKEFSQSLMVEKKAPFDIFTDEDWEQLSQDNKVQFRSPQQGMWLKVLTEGYSEHYMASAALKVAESSLDILRFALTSREIDLINYGIAYDPTSEIAHYAGSISMSSLIEYDKFVDIEVNALNKICEKPSRMESRIAQALKLIRIGDLIVEDSNKIFYYTAAIEKLILDNEPELKFKFSTRGALLLSKTKKARESNFQLLKQIYNQRSNVAHGSENEYNYFLTLESRNLARIAIREILLLIDSQGITDVYNNNKTKSLAHYLENMMWGTEN